MGIIVWLAFVILLGLYISGPIADPDIWWHIVSGRWIIANGAVPDVDYWNIFGAGKPWIAYSWLNEVIYAAVEARWGLNGLVFAQVVLNTVFAGVAMWALGKISGDRFFGALLGIIVVLASRGHIALRPQTFTWVLLLILLVTADGIAKAGLARNRLVSVFVLSALWANSHLTAILGVGCAALWSLGSIGNRKELIRVFFSVFFVGLLGCLATPYLGRETITLLLKSNHPFMFSTLEEFKPGQIIHFPIGILFLGLTILLMFAHKAPKALSAPRGLVVGLGVIASLAVVKFAPYGAILVCTGIATLWRERQVDSSIFGNLGESFSRLSALYKNKLQGPGFAVLVVGLIIVQFNRVMVSSTSLPLAPEKSLNFIKENKLAGPILNSFGDGGYLIYSYAGKDGSPGMLAPIDGRTNVNSEDLMISYTKAWLGVDGWGEYLDAVKPNVILWPTDRPLSSILKEREDWKLVYEEKGAVNGRAVFQRVQ